MRTTPYCIAALASFVSAGASAQALDHPLAKSLTTVSRTSVTAGETIDIFVKVDGDTRSQSVAIPATLLLVLDRSGSMRANGALGYMKQAATRLIGKLDANQDQAAVVVYDTRGSVLSGLTNDFATLTQRVNAIGLGGATNIAEGFSLGNSLLRAADSPKKVAILMTDGIPFPNEVQQRQAIFAELQGLAADLITYHTVGLGTVDPVLLDTIARRTGGVFKQTPAPAELERLFEEIYDAQSRKLTVKDLKIVEKLSPFLLPEHNSLTYSFTPGSNDEVVFKDTLNQRLPAFYFNGILEFPSLYDFPGGNFFGYTFRARIAECKHAQDIVVPLREKDATLDFLNGSKTRVSVQMTAPAITIRACGVYLDKQFDENSKTVTVALRNSLPTPIRDVHLIDEVNATIFDYTRDSDISPPPSRLDHAERQIEWRLDSVDPQSVKLLTYYLKDVAHGDPDVYAIEVDDHRSSWLLEKPAFNVLDSQLEFRDLESGIAAGKPPIRFNQLVGRELTLPANPKNGTISAAPAILRKHGFEWQLSYVLDKDIVFPSNKIPKNTPAFELYTGRFFLKKVERQYQLFAEFRRHEPLPMISTSPAYKPTP